MHENGSPAPSEESRASQHEASREEPVEAQDALGEDALGEDALDQENEPSGEASASRAREEDGHDGRHDDGRNDGERVSDDLSAARGGDATTPNASGATGSDWDATPPPAGAPEWPLEGADTALEAHAAGQMLPVPWTLRQTIIGTILTLGPWLLFAIGAQLAQLGAKQPTPQHKLSPSADLTSAIVIFIASSLLEAVFLIAPLVYAARTVPLELRGAAKLRAMLEALGLRRVEAQPILGFCSPVWSTVGPILGAIAVILASSVLYDAIRQALHIPLKTNADTLLDQAKYAPFTVIATLLVAVLVAPICEEVFFRGFVFPGLARKMSTWSAVVVSALVFGLAHADVGSFVVLVVIGVVLAVLRWRTDSLWPGVVVHTLNNAIALVGILILLRH